MKDSDSQDSLDEPNELRYLVVHMNCEPAQFTDLGLARKHIERLKGQGFSSPDVYQFDQRAGGWRKVEELSTSR